EGGGGSAWAARWWLVTRVGWRRSLSPVMVTVMVVMRRRTTRMRGGEKRGENRGGERGVVQGGTVVVACAQKRREEERGSTTAPTAGREGEPRQGRGCAKQGRGVFHIGSGRRRNGSPEYLGAEVVLQGGGGGWERWCDAGGAAREENGRRNRGVSGCGEGSKNNGVLGRVLPEMVAEVRRVNGGGGG
ncbi:hypothetical protein SOVF_206610, partial [Spinacia oleracea]